LKYIICKGKARENVWPLLNEVGALVAKDEEKAELLGTHKSMDPDGMYQRVLRKLADVVV